MLVTSKGKTESIKELVNASIQVLISALESGHSEVLSAYLKAIAKFHHYSFSNILLIATQKPNATRVAGIYAWNQLGRRVKKGEKGIMIFAPMLGRRRKSEPETNSDAKESDSEKTYDLIAFRPVYVWDVSQTEGKELPELETEVKGDVGSYLARLTDFTIKQGIKLGFSEKIAPAKGMSYDGAIRLLPDLQPAEMFSTLVHELSHEMLHKRERRTLTTKTVRETEAEAVAFVVCNAIGLETGNVSSDYIQLYHGNAALLRESLEIVQRTASVILGALSPEGEQKRAN
jgi:antirestriction protein ArdC